MEISSPNYTQFPNEILDEWMSLLTGSEFKIISIIVRKTFGWKKEKDKISISQLEMITGLGKTQITKSVKNLENRGFIICIKHKNKPAEYAIKVVQKVNYKSLKVVQKVNESSSESELQKLESSSESEHTKESNNINKLTKEIFDILEHWNLQPKLTTHTLNTAFINIKKKHNDIIKDIGTDKIIKAITNYSKILASEDYFFKYRWTLWDFIARGIYNFIPEAKPFENYLKNKKQEDIPYRDTTRPAKELIKEIYG